MRSWIAPAALAMLLLQGCGPQTPEAARIDNIEDAADNAADAIESASKNQIGSIRAEADTLAQQAEVSNGFDSERLKTRAEALRKEAGIVERHSEAQVRAVRDRARADVSAIKAQ
nr:hypothetical protein [uncultured organism]